MVGIRIEDYELPVTDFANLSSRDLSDTDLDSLKLELMILMQARIAGSVPTELTLIIRTKLLPIVSCLLFLQVFVARYALC